jgi:hypothetical protein
LSAFAKTHTKLITFNIHKTQRKLSCVRIVYVPINLDNLRCSLAVVITSSVHLEYVRNS